MLNLTSPDLVQVIYIPSNGNAPAAGSELSLSARSTHDESPVLAFILQEWEIVGDFVKACVEKPEGMHDGEWEYTLADSEGAVLSRGLMQVGAMPADCTTIQYNNETSYKQYGE